MRQILLEGGRLRESPLRLLQATKVGDQEVDNDGWSTVAPWSVQFQGTSVMDPSTGVVTATLDGVYMVEVWLAGQNGSKDISVRLVRLPNSVVSTARATLWLLRSSGGGREALLPNVPVPLLAGQAFVVQAMTMQGGNQSVLGGTSGVQVLGPY